MSVLSILHILSAVIWVGGMFFAYVCLRPVAADLLQPEQRLSLWCEVFKRFFLWVWVVVLLLIISGHSMIAVLGGMAVVGAHVHIMLGVGYVMIAAFMHVFFAPYKRLKQATAAGNWQEAGHQLNQIRRIVLFNLILGIATVSIAAGGRYVF